MTQKIYSPHLAGVYSEGQEHGLPAGSVKVIWQPTQQSGDSLGTTRWGPYQTDVGSALGLKASRPIGFNISYSKSKDTASRVLERDMPNTWVTTLRKPRVWHSHQTFLIFPVQGQFINRGNFYLKWCCLVIWLMYIMRLTGEQS